MDSYVASLLTNKKIILFDAQCKLCSAWCNFMIANDAHAKFKLCSVQSSKGELLLSHFGYSTKNYGSMVYVENGQAFTQSTAFFKIIKQLGYPWKTICVFSLLPDQFNNWLYNKIAVNRYALFGKYRYCRLALEQDKAHYL